MATETPELNDETKGATTGTSSATGREGGCAESMAEHFAGAGDMSAMFEAMAKCCSAFGSGAQQSPPPTETDEAPAGTETASCRKEA